MKKRKAVDSYLHAIRNTVGKDKSVIMPYGNRSFPPSSKDEKRWGAHNKQGSSLLPEERSCTCDGGMKEYRRTIHCWIGVSALRAI